MQTQSEAKTAILIFIAFWVFIFLIIVLLGRLFPKICAFRTCMLSKWKPALVFAAVFYLGSCIGGNSLVNPYVLAVFSQAMIGLAIADGMERFSLYLSQEQSYSEKR